MGQMLIWTSDMTSGCPKLLASMWFLCFQEHRAGNSLLFRAFPAHPFLTFSRRWGCFKQDRDLSSLFLVSA